MISQGRQRAARRLGALAVAAAAAVIVAAPASAGPEEDLAERYAPVVRLVEQTEDCGHGEPYQPTDIDVLLPDDGVVLRGPWDKTNVVQVAPGAGDLAPGRLGYHLDFPGDPLEPGCTYEEWSDYITAGSKPTTYARVLTEPGKPGKLALQYWFFYIFNDFNNKHEGDWEMVQLVFDADDAAEALGVNPTEIGYSQHEGAERAAWGSDKLGLVDRTHPVVYPADGSHANYYSEALFLGRSAAEGVGCDDTQGPSTELRPDVQIMASDQDAYLVAYPWLGFQGHWGERQPAFYNGPTGPNTKTQWTMPITWSEEHWRDDAFAVPAAGVLNTNATDFFCTAVGAGSDVLTKIVRNPGPAVIVLGVLALLVLWAASRTEWRASPPLRIGHQRQWGEIVTATWGLYRRHFRLFVGIGVLFILLGLAVAALQYLLFRVSTLSALTDSAGESNAVVAFLAFGLGLVFILVGLTITQAAVAHAMVELDAGRSTSALDVYRSALGRVGALAGSLLRAVVVITILNLTLVGIPVAAWLTVRWSLLAQVVQIEGHPPRGALQRSGRLVAGHWWKVASIAVFVTGFALVIGPFLGALLLLVSTASFDVVNIVAAVVYMLTLPLASIATTYVYCDARAREAERAETPHALRELPAEVTFS